MAEKKDEKKGVRCSLCGFRRRGSNHDNGVHHQTALRTMKRRRCNPKG